MSKLKTVCSIFFVPTLKISRDKLTENNFLNAYIKDIRKEVNYENAVYLLFKPKNLDKFKHFLDNEYEKSSVIEDYSYSDGYIVVVYSLNSHFKDDFELIKQGRYSKTSKEFQSLFPEEMRIVENNEFVLKKTVAYRVFNKTKDLQKYWQDRIGQEFDPDMEVWSGWDENYETLNIENYKETV